MLDGSRELDDEDRFIAGHLEPGKTVVVINKTDLEQKIHAEDITALIYGHDNGQEEAAGTRSGKEEGFDIIETSLADESGAVTVEKTILSRVMSGETKQGESITVTNARHEKLLRDASKSISDALAMTGQEEPLEIIEIDVNSAYESLGEIIGVSVGDDIIDEMFSRFCLGK
jgi:tRNA modification GTPase